VISGIEFLLRDLLAQGYGTASSLRDANGGMYALVPEFEIPAGTFAGRVIDLAIPAPPDYPRGGIASIHVRSAPHLVGKGNTGTRNVIDSPLGIDWQYWSYQFQLRPINTTSELLAQINGVFRRN
jgi:hypothetical protein